MRNIKLVLEYDGSRYQGWARLGKGESGNTISNKLLEVLKRMTEESDLELNCGCRTEVGVHAYGQVVNFKTNCQMKLVEMQHYLNRYLPMDIAVVDMKEMPERFHAQLNAKSKTYVYKIAIDDVPSVFERKYIYHCYKTPDKAKMELAAKKMLGSHDFKNFSTVKKAKSTIREIYDIDIYGGMGEMQITIQASDFLHNMARLMISTLLEVGLGTRKATDIDLIFAGKMAPGEPCDPKGLFLQEVEY
ncbi:MAG: tRNA pseudouridine(38-40) synthase TruA [Dorea sp.]|nr:tRNA pseudouridine(38-40) synthase TruA [Dorea sp.]